MTDKPMSDQEARMLAVTFEIINAWAEVWVDVHEGKKTVQEAFDEYNDFLVPIGQMIALSLSLPGVADQLTELKEQYEREMANLQE